MNKNPPSRTLLSLFVASAFCMIGTHASAAPTVNWDAVKGQDIVLFYPGQASWEWLLTDHSASKSVKNGTKCLECHDGEEKDMGTVLVSGKKLEPTPISGKSGFLKANAKFARDNERLYVRVEWTDPNFHAPKKMDPDNAVKLAVMFASGKVVKEAAIAGCWAGCHDDATDMASATTGKERTLYLPASRNKLKRQGGGDDFKSPAELETLLKSGVFMEYWQAKLNKGQPAKAGSGYILEKRHKPEKSIDATSAFKDGKWTVVMSRPLKSSGDGQEDFAPGSTYMVGFAIHDDYTEGRFHYLSFGRNLAIDSGNADFIAVKQ
ncbi:MAG: ethylbenzene dehydrogenase-related protein [Gammaproteobacteria bacterium]